MITISSKFRRALADLAWVINRLKAMCVGWRLAERLGLNRLLIFCDEVRSHRFKLDGDDF
jgi:hypothetical protein